MSTRTDYRDRLIETLRERDTAIRERDQAISLLRRIYFDHEPDSVFAADEFVATYAVDECVAGDARAFLSRLSAPANKEGRE